MNTLFLIVNSACDITCSYCFYTTGHEKRSRERIFPNRAKRIVDRVSALGFSTVILTGGDPLKRRFKAETYVLVRELKNRGIRVILNTSGAYTTVEDLEIIRCLAVDRVDISIDSHDCAIHDAQRGRHVDSAGMITGLIERGFKNVATTTVVTPANAPTLRETIVWLQSLGVGDIRLQKAFVPNSLEKDADLVMLSFRQRVMELPASHLRDYAELTECAFRKEPSLAKAVCQMGREYLVCAADGTLTRCFHRPDVVFGNVFRDSIEALRARLCAYNEERNTLPDCFGPHCVSLFDNPKFWRK